MHGRAVGVALAADGGDLAARAIAGIDQAARRRSDSKSGGVVGDVFALPARRGLVERRRASPGRRGSPSSYSGRERAGSVSSKRSSRRPPRRAPIGVAQRGIGVAEMQEAIRRRGEAEDGLQAQGLLRRATGTGRGGVFSYI